MAPRLEAQAVTQVGALLTTLRKRSLPYAKKDQAIDDFLDGLLDPANERFANHFHRRFETYWDRRDSRLRRRAALRPPATHEPVAESEEDDDQQLPPPDNPSSPSTSASSTSASPSPAPVPAPPAPSSASASPAPASPAPASPAPASPAPLQSSLAPSNPSAHHSALSASPASHNPSSHQLASHGPPANLGAPHSSATGFQQPQDPWEPPPAQEEEGTQDTETSQGENGHGGASSDPIVIGSALASPSDSEHSSPEAKGESGGRSPFRGMPPVRDPRLPAFGELPGIIRSGVVGAIHRLQQSASATSTASASAPSSLAMSKLIDMTTTQRPLRLGPIDTGEPSFRETFAGILSLDDCQVMITSVDEGQVKPVMYLLRLMSSFIDPQGYVPLGNSISIMHAESGVSQVPRDEQGKPADGHTPAGRILPGSPPDALLSLQERWRYTRLIESHKDRCWERVNTMPSAADCFSYWSATRGLLDLEPSNEDRMYVEEIIEETVDRLGGRRGRGILAASILKRGLAPYLGIPDGDQSQWKRIMSMGKAVSVFNESAAGAAFEISSLLFSGCLYHCYSSGIHRSGILSWSSAGTIWSLCATEGPYRANAVPWLPLSRLRGSSKRAETVRMASWVFCFLSGNPQSSFSWAGPECRSPSATNHPDTTTRTPDASFNSVQSTAVHSTGQQYIFCA
ncbi:MAG: hypothetical protein Q9198_006071 [Flavoplaca austrocitrina]